jgi:hypothetical protein
MLSSEFLELFGTVGKAVNENDHMLSLVSVLVKLADADIPRKIPVLLRLHRLHTGKRFCIV